MTRSVLTASVLSMCLLTSSAAYPQERCADQTSASTSLVGEARFQIVTLPETADAYRLDRITGEVSILQRSGSRFTAMTMVWKALPRATGEDGPPATSGVNYQLVLSPRANFPLLMHVHSGATWTLRTAAGDVKWEALAIER